MDSKNRLDFARDLLVKLYNEHAKLSDEELLDMMYDFLMGKEHSKYLLAEKLCYTYEIRPEELELYRHDMIIDIIFTVYQYWRYVKTMHATSPLEEEIMSELEDLPFSIGQLQGYFHDAKNELKVRTLLLDYFVYTTQPKQFILDCQEYIQEEPTIFYDELARYESYIGVLDEIALIYDDVYAKYHPEEEEESYSFDLVYLNEDEELDEEELEEEISSELEILEQVQQELFETILNYLEDVYQDKDDIDDFIGFFMSYVYAFLCQAKQTPITKDGQQMATSVLTIEDEELLKLLNHPDANFEVITESFWCNKEYVFDCVEFFCREYFLRGGKIFEEREKIQDRNAQKRIEMMDPLYTKPQVELNILYVGKPIARIFDQLLMEVKRNHPVDYTEEIYEIAMNAQKAEEAFKPYELSKVGMKHYQNLLMRYLSRKYLEKVNFQTVGSIDIDEWFICEGLIYADLTNANIQSLFLIGYPRYIASYFEMMSLGKNHHKRIVRRLEGTAMLTRLMNLDPSCLTESAYCKLYSESDFYIYLDTHGAPKTAQYLQQLHETQPEKCMEFLKELLVSNYYYAKNNEKKDDISTQLMQELESGTPDATYLNHVLQDKKTLTELLQRYRMDENQLDYTISYEEKLESSPKVKQKFYPSDKRVNG